MYRTQDLRPTAQDTIISHKRATNTHTHACAREIRFHRAIIGHSNTMEWKIRKTIVHRTPARCVIDFSRPNQIYIYIFIYLLTHNIV